MTSQTVTAFAELDAHNRSTPTAFLVSFSASSAEECLELLALALCTPPLRRRRREGLEI